MQRLLICSLLAALAALPVQAEEVTIDKIVAIVDDSVITQRDLQNRIRLVEADFRRGNRRMPPAEVLRRQVLENLISDSLLLQEARRRGLRITDSQLNQTMQRIARQSNVSLSDYRRAIIADGLDYEQYRETVRREITISTLRNQYGQRNASISDTEVDEFIANSGEGEVNYEYHLSHILIAVPDAASPETVEQAQRLAEELISRLDQGEAFDELANTFSSGDTALQGGDLGWRKRAEIPSLFTEPALGLEPGGYEGPIRSASGFHIVHLRDRRNAEQVLVTQMRTRHILIKPNELVSEEDARTRLAEFRQRILDGEDFARLARLYSVDYVTGAEGGDVGWAEMRTMAPEYAETARQLEIGELSEPFRTRFGWHLLEVTDRKTVDETLRSKRERIRSQLLQQKQVEVFDLWKRRLRDEAFVAFPGQSDA